MPRKSQTAPEPVMPTPLPVRPGEAYSAEELAPYATDWLVAYGVDIRGGFIPGIDIRQIAKGKKRFGGIERFRTRRPDGLNHSHRYTIEEAADTLVALAKVRGLSVVGGPAGIAYPLPEPFRGHDADSRAAAAARPARKVTRKPATARKVTRKPGAAATVPATVQPEASES